MTHLYEEKQRGHARVLVSFSNGKDSRALLDLCVRAFGVENVRCFFMYFLPNLRYNHDVYEWPRRRYGIEVLGIPHWGLFTVLRDAPYSFPDPAFERIEPPTLYQMWDVARKRAGIRLVAMGGKKADSRFRRKTIHQIPEHGGVAPMENWSKSDVLTYCRARSIPVPTASAGTDGNTFGVGLTRQSILWLYDTMRDDYERIRNVFPFVEAIIKRREFYGDES